MDLLPGIWMLILGGILLAAGILLLVI